MDQQGISGLLPPPEGMTDVVDKHVGTMSFKPHIIGELQHYQLARK